ncbi:MAG: TldD/PmbA family protein [Myxococcota bacterium]|nr:TldD/PmbA family protein [Myxococcota bacterium]
MADKQTLQDVARAAVAQARKKGAQEAAATVSRKREVDVTWRDGKLEKISEATAHQLRLELYVDGRYAAVQTSDLRPEGLTSFISHAVAMTRALEKDPHRSLPDPALYRDRAQLDLMLEDSRHAELTPDERRRLAREAEEAARAVKGRAQVLSVTTSFSDTLAETFRVASNGFAGEQRETGFVLFAEMSVKDPDGRRPEDYAFAHSRRLDGLPPAAQIGREVAERTHGRVGARKVPSGAMTMVLDNRAAGRLVSALLAPLSGQSLQQKRSFLEGKVGQRVGSARLSLVDDPHLPRGLGSRLFDAEGISARKFPLVEGGVLRNYYIDWYYGRKLGMAPTTGRPSNLSWGLGDKTQAQLIADVKEGIFVTSFIGGNSNSTTGDFSMGVLGFRIRGGRLAEPIGEMNVSGNHAQLWQRLVAVGNDPYPYSVLRTPTLVFDGVQFAGA